MAGITVDVSGLRLLAGDLAGAAAAAVPAMTTAIAATAYRVEAGAKLRCPVDTGFLRNSISTTIEGMTAEVGPSADYGAFVEYGTSRMGPQPYMGPALDEQMSSGNLERMLSTLLSGLL